MRRVLGASDMAFWTGVQELQVLIVGIIGFAGVMFTLSYTARQARKQRQEERRHDCETLRAALIEELIINRNALISHLEKVDESSETRAYLVPTDSMDDVYRAFTDRIGLLSQAEVSKVMYAYLTLRTYGASLFLFGVPTQTSPKHVEIPATNAMKLRKMTESLVGPVNEAIGIMERARDAG